MSEATASHDGPNHKIWENIDHDTKITPDLVPFAAKQWAQQKISDDQVELLKNGYIRPDSDTFPSPELPQSESFSPAPLINKNEPLENIENGQIAFNDPKTGKIYQIPVHLINESVSKNQLGDPVKRLRIDIDCRKLVERKPKIINLGSKNLKVPIEILAKVIKTFELIGESHSDSLPKNPREAGDLAVRWENHDLITPYILIARTTTNVDQSWSTFKKALELTTKNSIGLQLPKSLQK